MAWHGVVGWRKGKGRCTMIPRRGGLKYVLLNVGQFIYRGQQDVLTLERRQVGPSLSCDIATSLARVPLLPVQFHQLQPCDAIYTGPSALFLRALHATRRVTRRFPSVRL